MKQIEQLFSQKHFLMMVMNDCPDLHNHMRCFPATVIRLPDYVSNYSNNNDKNEKK